MSRSYKHSLFVKDNNNKRIKEKRFANKRVRRTNDISNGKQYKKVYYSWNIYDYIARYDLSYEIMLYNMSTSLQKMYPTFGEYNTKLLRTYRKK